ncbi:hypothetical protein K501DRAFT_288779 [Backusella circina FSU 941]|nr:hypothetical protein K501DRAFT_288779 [Backusella circina FSU 941]
MPLNSKHTQSAQHQVQKLSKKDTLSLKLKKHANWSLHSNTFENFYYKPRHQDHSSTAINHSIFSQPENTITFADGVEPTEIVLGTTNNPYVGETKSKNVVDAHPWYRRFF